MQAAVPFYGVYDFTRFDDAMHPSMPELLEKVDMKQPHATNLEAYTQASPVNNVSADAPPFFVLHGRNDSLVAVEQARSFVAKLEDVSTLAGGVSRITAGPARFRHVRLGARRTRHPRRRRRAVPRRDLHGSAADVAVGGQRGVILATKAVLR